MRPIGSPAALERRRGRAIALLEDGRAPVDVAQIVGVDRRSVRRWKAAYRDEGREALKAKAVPGRPSRMDEKSKVRLEKKRIMAMFIQIMVREVVKDPSERPNLAV